MKTVAIGDTHGRTLWKSILRQEGDCERIIFIGDYFDTHDDISAVEQMDNFKQIIEYKETCGKEVIMLIGNHDHHYFQGVGYSGTSGYQRNAAVAISAILEENRHHLQMCYKMGDIYFSHAGISPEWLELENWENEPIDEYVNDLWKYKPLSFCFNGTESTGDNTYQTPIWIRPRSLMRACQEWKKDVIQVCGHTQVRQIDTGKATGGRYWFIDCLGTSKEYLVIEDNVISVGKL